MFRRFINLFRRRRRRPSVEAVLPTETLKIGEKNDAFHVLSRHEIRINDQVEATETSTKQGFTALLLNNGALGALICRCPKGFSGGCTPGHHGGVATCIGGCDHDEIDLSHNCIWGYVPPSGVADMVLAPL